ncbi:MAG: hydrolase [Firmicutes bacterium]|nr:hydrolase [Bacillota bacterium]
MRAEFIPEFSGNLRQHMLRLPEEIRQCRGIRIFGKRIKSIIFTTDVAIIRNSNADAVIAVYPFTPQPVITHALMMAADIPVFCGVGGGTTTGRRVANLALHAEYQGAIGVVLNAPSSNDTVITVAENIDIPIVITVVSEKDDIESRLRAGASILNVAAAHDTPQLVRSIRQKFPNIAIIATGGPSPANILETIEAGANAITWSPPSNGELFKDMMERYRRQSRGDIFPE